MRGHTVVRASVIAAGILAIAAECTLNPLRRSKPEIRDWLLKQAPLGSSFADVKALIAKRKWGAQHEGWGGTRDNAFPLTGIHWLQANLGKCQGVPWQCHVRAAWGFDGERLVDVYVESWCEGI